MMEQTIETNGAAAAFAPFGVASTTLELRTEDESCFHDITDEVRDFVEQSGIHGGMVVAQSLHTTAGLLLNESETGFKGDFARVADRLVPCKEKYVHDDFSVRWENICPEDFEAPNGHSHLQQAIFGAPSVTLIVQDGTLVLGRWQRLFVLEFDRPRDRRVALSAFGVRAPMPMPPSFEANGHHASANGNGATPAPQTI